jgi:hypothetical protein
LPPWGNPNWRLVSGGWYVTWIQPLFFAYLALLLGVLLASLRRWRTSDLVPVAVMSFWCLLALWHQRASTDAVLLTYPLVAAGLSAVWWLRRTWAVWVGISGLGLVVGVVVVTMTSVVAETEGWNRFEPRCAAAAIARLGLSGHMLSSTGLGNIDPWLLYRFWPEVRVYQTWEYVMGEAGFTALKIAKREGGLAGVQAFLDRYGVDTLLLHSVTEEYALRLEAHGWRRVHKDNRFFILVRRTPATAALIQREGYRHIRMLKGALETVTAENAGEVLQEAERALRHCPEDATFVWAYKTVALRELGRHAEAQDAGRQIPAQLIIPW